MKRLSLCILIGILMAGCAGQAPPANSSSAYQEICGRDEGASLARAQIYRVRVPEGWVRKDPKPEESLVDSTKPLCEFTIEGNGGQRIRITVHNFPVDRSEDRTPPGAQVARWKRQFNALDPMGTTVTAQSFGGFAGLLFEGSGRLNNEDIAVMGWAMQLAPEHYSNLSALLGRGISESQISEIKQMRADYTIKATGPTDMLKANRSSIINFARSFELIQAISSS